MTATTNDVAVQRRRAKTNISVRLTQAQLDLCYEVGGTNVSEGIRRVLNAALAARVKTTEDN